MVFLPGNGLDTTFAAWSIVALLWAVATLLLPPLKCLGGGHLYVFHAVVPVAVLWGAIVDRGGVVGSLGFLAASVATMLALWLGLITRLRTQRSLNVEADPARPLVEFLRQVPPTRVAIMPTVAAERVAFETNHSVLWGGHGLGFRHLEHFWPIVRCSLTDLGRLHKLGVIAIDATWWPEAEQVLKHEMPECQLHHEGSWLVARLLIEPNDR